MGDRANAKAKEEAKKADSAKAKVIADKKKEEEDEKKEEGKKEAKAASKENKKEIKKEENRIKDENKSLKELVVALNSAKDDVSSKTKGAADADASVRKLAGEKLAASNQLKAAEQSMLTRNAAVKEALKPW